MKPENLRKSAMANAFIKCQPEGKNENLQQQVKPFVLPPLVKRKASDRPQSSSNSFQTPPISLRRRTTTTLDFPVHSAGSLQRGRRVLCSPTRKNNPQPNGLVFQNAYNRHNKSYEIWDPNSITVESNIPAMMEHLKDVNFVCKHTGYQPISERSIPEVKYSKESSYRQTFRQPDLMDNGQHVHPTRFGHTPNTCPAVGIVPNVIARKQLDQ